MKKILSLFLMISSLFCTNNLKAQTPYLEDITVNGNPIANCSTIDFGNNNSVNLSLKLRITKPQTTSVGNFATFKLYIRKSLTSTPQLINGIMILDGAFYNQGTTWEGVFSQTLQASDINATGSMFYGIYEISSTLQPKTCEYGLIKPQTPTFKLSPASIAIGCSSTSPVTFTINNVYNSPGSLGGIWYVGSGWSQSGIITTTTNTLTLTPTSYPPSSISVTPVYNGVGQIGSGCIVSSAAFSGTAQQIYGKSYSCAGTSNYSIGVTNCSIVWSLDNPALGTLSPGANANSVILNIPSGANGILTLTAKETNPCGQVGYKTKTIAVGAPVLPNSSYVTGPSTVGYRQNVSYSYIGGPTGANYQWSIDAPFDDSGSSTACNWSITSGQGTNRINVKTGCTGAVVRVAISNSCGQSSYKYEYVTASQGSTPCGSKINIFPNPSQSRSSDVIATVVPIPCDTLNTEIDTASKTTNELKVFDFSGNLVYSKKDVTNKFNLRDSSLKKGIYLVQITNSEGETAREKLVIN
jgi:hypothetical protein